MALNNLRDSNPDNNKSIDPRILKSLQAIDKDENYANALISKQKQLKQESYKQANVSGKLQDFKTQSVNLITPISVNIGGQKINLNREELYEIYSKNVENEDKGKLIPGSVLQYQSGNNLSSAQKKYNQILNILNSSKVNNDTKVKIKNILISGQDKFFDKSNVKKYQEIYNQGNKKYLENLSKLSGKMAPQVKAAPMDKNGKITPAVAGSLSAMITSRQLGKYGAPGTDDNKASEFLNDDNIKNTKVFVKQQGSDYEIWIKNEKDPKNIQKYKVDPGKINALFGPGYVNDTSNESMRKLIGKGNTNLTKDPNVSIMKKSFGDFPRVRKLNITADLPEDLSNSDEHIISINLKKKDGRWQNFMLSDTNNLGRVGFEQGKKLLNNLSDSEIIKYIKVEYPNYDFSQLQGY